MEEVGDISIEAPNGLLAISSDKNTLFVADPNPEVYSKSKVYRVNVATDELEILQVTQSSDEIRDIQLSEDDETLFVIHDNDYPDSQNAFVDCWNSSTLSSSKILTVPDQPFSLTVQQDDLYIIFGQRYLNHWESGGLYRYRYEQGELIASWKFLQAPHYVVVPSSVEFMYVFGFKNWIVPLD